jgi:hypothetical protein
MCKLALIVESVNKNAFFQTRTLTNLFWISLAGLGFKAKNPSLIYSGGVK